MKIYGLESQKILIKVCPNMMSNVKFNVTGVSKITHF